MDFKKIFIKNACPTNVGGQAVLEGIMMKGNDRTAVVVRLPDDSMYIHTEKLASRGKAYKIPIVRGVMIFVNSLVTGIRTLMLSAELLEKGGYFDEDEDAAQADGSAELNESAGSDYTETVMESHEAHGSDYTETVMESHETHGSDYTETVTAPHEAHGSDYTEAVMASHEARESNASEAKESAEGGRFTRWLEARFGEKAPLTLTLISAVVISLAFTIGVFIIAPTWIVDFFGIWVKNKIALNLIEGVFRILLFVLYILLVSRMKDIKMVFQFHGAEHQCIHCYEGGKELTPENCEDYETLHPRCGTSFLMFVMVIALLLFSLLGWPNLIIRIT
ncbi:MAG: DUF1385 domain-containing protein, partial [Clostridiales Family XIII bacterium]|nr:DUF1385 domain-containing protein [Clostridiales Family XIII bacterium]